MINMWAEDMDSDAGDSRSLGTLASNTSQETRPSLEEVLENGMHDAGYWPDDEVSESHHAHMHTHKHIAPYGRHGLPALVEVRKFVRPGLRIGPGVMLTSRSQMLRKEALREMEDISNKVSGTLKDQKVERQRKGSTVKRMAKVLAEEEAEAWMKSRNLQGNCRFSLAQLRDMKDWFDSMDRKGKGGIGVNEFAIPLLATGIAKSTKEVEDLVQKADRSGSGSIAFNDFLSAASGRKGGDTCKLVQLQEIQHSSTTHYDIRVVVGMERRRLLMEAVLDGAKEREVFNDDLIGRWERAVETGDQKAIKAAEVDLKELLSKSERSKQINEYVSAVTQTTNFRQEMSDTWEPGGGPRKRSQPKQHTRRKPSYINTIFGTNTLNSNVNNSGKYKLGNSSTKKRRDRGKQVKPTEVLAVSLGRDTQKVVLKKGLLSMAEDMWGTEGEGWLADTREL